MTSVSQHDDHTIGGQATAVLTATGLTVGFPGRSGTVLAADQVDLRLARARITGLVGESGCGKSVTLRALIGLVRSPGRILGGTVRWDGRDLLALAPAKLREVRGRDIAMIFQDPASCLNPVVPVGDQVAQALRVKLGTGRKEARARAVDLLAAVGIPAPAQRARDYPHQLSGGMRQRVMIAAAIACEPRLLLADEPTTALDVTVQDQIVSLLVDLQHRTAMSVVLVSHDLALISEVCDDITVMYAGRVVESGSRDAVIGSPRHPYTQALLGVERSFHSRTPGGRLAAVGGEPPDLRNLPPGCPFQPRCPHAAPQCASVSMALDRQDPEHRSACPFAGGGQ